ncbi:MAG: hypothetical protein EZS28_047429, partial [Streblomastix strix]
MGELIRIGTKDNKWRGLQGATEAELKCNQHLNKIQLHFAKYSTTHSLSQLEPKKLLNSEIQLIEPNLRELIAQKQQQDVNQPFKFPRASEYLYQTIHALHVGLIPALNRYRKILVAREEQFEKLSPELEQLTISPFPSVLSSQVEFEDFIKSICEVAEFQHNKKLAHQLMIEENKQPQSQEIQSLLTKPLISSDFKYNQAITSTYNDAVHHLHPSFREETHQKILSTLAQIREAKQLLEQSYGYNTVIAYSDLLEKATKFYDFVAWLYLRQLGEISGYGLDSDGQLDDDIGYWDYEQ